MKKLLVAAMVASAAAEAGADVGAFVGVTYAFGAKTGLGLTVQATSTRREDRAIAAAGISVYPFSGTPSFGIPVGIGYQGKNAAGIVSYDVLQQNVAVSGGYVDTRSPSTPSVTVVVPPPSPD